jgi:hypothetical protein
VHALIVLRLILLTGPDNQRVEINPESIATLREPRGEIQQHFHKSTKCLVFTTDGKFVGVTQSCAEVRKLIEDAEAPP